jgi:hypothetical protein
MYNRRRKWTFWVAVWFFGTCAVALVGLIIGQALGPKPANPRTMIPTEPAASPPASRTAAASGTSTPPAGSTGSQLTGPVQLVASRKQVSGVALGWPHSEAGAISAADAAETELLSTLNPDRAAAVMRLIADPGYSSAPQQAAQGVTADRTSLGIPATGPVPSGDSLQTVPVEVQVRDVTPGQVTVLFLGDFIGTVSGQGTQTRIGVFPVAVRWSGGDWHMLPSPAENYESLTADPGSPQAAALGWQQIEPAQTGG